MSSAKTSSLWRDTKTRTQSPALVLNLGSGHWENCWVESPSDETCRKNREVKLHWEGSQWGGESSGWRIQEGNHLHEERELGKKQGDQLGPATLDAQFFFFSSALTGIGSWCSPTNFSPNSSWIQLLGRSKCWAAPVLSWADQAGGGKLLGRAWETAECGKEAGQDKKNVQQNYGRCLDLHSPWRDGSNLQR